MLSKNSNHRPVHLNTDDIQYHVGPGVRSSLRALVLLMSKHAPTDTDRIFRCALSRYFSR
jgi:hypothetical protein